MTRKPFRPSAWLPAMLLALVLPGLLSAQAQEWKQVLDLRGTWKFELGDRPEWAEPGFRDQEWNDVFVPSPWEDEGFPGYDGYAWYRKRFTPGGDLAGGTIYLQLGNVDDVCDVYLNGYLVGTSGSFPPHFRTAYDAQISLALPAGILSPGRENVLALRVYDEHLGGGIVRGRVGLFEPKDMIRADVPLPAVWKFSTGDTPEWKESSFDDSGWRDAMVPAAWDLMGLQEYDGFGWYRVRFTVPKELRSRQLILLLGKIDDLDEVWLNGKQIGRTGRIRQGGFGSSLENEHLELRAYTIPPEVLASGENVLAVRVFDGMFTGGIYDGPIGIVTRERYQSWSGRPRPKEEKKRWWELFDW